jgi:hypothetical protein
VKKVVDDWSNIVIAYEPIWAIGTGKVASPGIYSHGYRISSFQSKHKKSMQIFELGWQTEWYKDARSSLTSSNMVRQLQNPLELSMVEVSMRRMPKISANVTILRN